MHSVVSFLHWGCRNPMDNLCILGVDLAGVPHRPTGMCVPRSLEARTLLSYTDDEIIMFFSVFRYPDIGHNSCMVGGP